MITVVGITGYTGRMGQAIVDVIQGHPSATLGGGVTRSEVIPLGSSALPPQERPSIVTDDPEKLFPECDVIIDFSHPSATPNFARNAAIFGKPFMSGTTGLTEEDMNVLKQVGQAVPVLYASNTSLSLVVMRQLVKLASTLLKDHDYDISILDKHHRWKKDAPSGTALTLGRMATEGNGGAREPSYASLRVGSIVGEHEVLFSGAGESINIHHQVTDRRVFARGAVQAALWLHQQKAGFYTMDDVLRVG